MTLYNYLKKNFGNNHVGIFEKFTIQITTLKWKLPMEMTELDD